MLDQLNRDELVFDAHPAGHCEVHKKKKYYCKEREGDVEFDVVVEVRRKGRTEPYLYVVFECKNHKKPIEDSYVREFSDKVFRVFGHAVKGVVVVSSRLQSGAVQVARNRRLGIVKFDENGIDVIADRTVGAWAENRYIQNQIIVGRRRSKSFKFSSFIDGSYFGSFDQMLHSFEIDSTDARNKISDQQSSSVVFIPELRIQDEL